MLMMSYFSGGNGNAQRHFWWWLLLAFHDSPSFCFAQFRHKSDDRQTDRQTDRQKVRRMYSYLVHVIKSLIIKLTLVHKNLNNWCLDRNAGVYMTLSDIETLFHIWVVTLGSTRVAGVLYITTLIACMIQSNSLCGNRIIFPVFNYIQFIL